MYRLAVAPLLLLPAFARPQGPPDIPALMTAGNTAYMRGDYDAARESFTKAWDIAQQTTTPNDPVRYDVLKRLTSVRAAAGEFADADNYLQQAITLRENQLGDTDPKIALRYGFWRKERD